MSNDQGFVLFKRTREMELKIAEFLTNIIHGGFLFSAGLEKYFEKGANEDFIDIRNQISGFEAKNDALRRDVEIQLYIQMILPDMRSDILRLLEGCDQVINIYEENLILMSVECPKIPKGLQEQLSNMVKSTLECANALVISAQCFFSGISVEEHAKQVSFFEHEIDLQAMELKKKVFSDKKITLASQLQLKDFIYNIERISDRAEDVADRVSIMSVKHSL